LTDGGDGWRWGGLCDETSLYDHDFHTPDAVERDAIGITVEAIARGRDGRFVRAGICWVVERSFAWLSRYRRLNTIFERSKEHLIAFVAIALISILARRLTRLVTVDMSA
jgi:hypothetical protein